MTKGKCECGGELILLEIFCDNTRSKGKDWFRDVKERYVCDKCDKNHTILVHTIKQDDVCK